MSKKAVEPPIFTVEHVPRDAQISHQNSVKKFFRKNLKPNTKSVEQCAELTEKPEISTECFSKDLEQANATEKSVPVQPETTMLIEKETVQPAKAVLQALEPLSSKNLQKSISKRPYVIISKWGYPYGGGEDYMLDTMFYAAENLGLSAIWLCYTNAKNENYKQTAIEDCYSLRGTTKKNSNGRTCVILRVMDGFSQRSVYAWLRLLRPALVHHQGALKSEVESVCALLRIPVLSGYHFWHGMLILSQKTNNTRIIEHARQHRIDDEFRKKIQRPKTLVYVASQFMKDALSSVAANNKLIDSDEIEYYKQKISVLAPLSREDKIAAPNVVTSAADARKYIVFINIHESKGGSLLLHLMRKLPHVPFLGVRTDCFMTEVDKMLDIEFNKPGSVSKCVSRCENVSEIYAQATLVVVASTVDETFCRVFVEASANGVPVLTSNYGNLPYLCVTEDARREMLVAADLHLKSADALGTWTKKISEFYEDRGVQQSLRAITIDNYARLRQKIDPVASFSRAVTDLICSDADRPLCVALLTPWCDQGLGIQNRNYARMLLKCGFRVVVFAFMPYSQTKQRADESEWILPGVDVYESKNVRERVLDSELVAFANRYQVDVAILAETCWDRVFGTILRLRSLGVRTIAVPNIEIVRRDEIDKHSVFDMIALNNHVCGRVFHQHGFADEKLFYLGYAIEAKDALYESDRSAESHNVRGQVEQLLSSRKWMRTPQLAFFSSLRDTVEHRPIRFLVLGGLNAVSRKHVDVVVQGFIEAQQILLAKKKRRAQRQSKSSKKNRRQSKSVEDRVSMCLIATSQKQEPSLVNLQAKLNSNGLFGRDQALEQQNPNARCETPPMRRRKRGERNKNRDDDSRDSSDSSESSTESSDFTSPAKESELLSIGAYSPSKLLADEVTNSCKLLISHLSGADIDKLYRWCDVFILISKHEGLGIGFYEAQNYGKPILTFNIPPHNEIVDEKIGWTIEPDIMRENDENDSGCLKSARVSASTLAKFFVKIGKTSERDWRLQYENMQKEIASRVCDRLPLMTERMQQIIKKVMQ